MSKPLQGIRVLDLSHMLSGPYAGMILADLGAETIKIEPLSGEGTRTLLADDPRHSFNGMGAYFLTLNRNKQSVCIDLKHADGLALFHELVCHADVVLDNFSAGVVQRLKIDHAHLSQINPRIISCSISGFGQNGPNYLRPAFDQVIQGIGGGMSITGDNAEHPTRAGIPIGDLGGGMFAVMGILAALQARGRRGCGQHVDISMLDCQISMLNYMATMYLLSGENPEPLGNAHFVHVPYNSYRTADGFIIIAVIFDSFWDNLVALLDAPALRDEKYRVQAERLANRTLIDSILSDILATASTADWVARLTAARVPCAPVNRFSQALADSQVRHRRMVVEIPHPTGGSVEAPGNPIKLSLDDEDSYSAPPLLGQHTDAVLQRLLGYDPTRIARLKQQKVLG